MAAGRYSDEFIIGHHQGCKKGSFIPSFIVQGTPKTINFVLFVWNQVKAGLSGVGRSVRSVVYLIARNWIVVGWSLSAEKERQFTTNYKWPSQVFEVILQRLVA